MTSIRLAHLEKVFPGGHAAVRNLNLTINDGELLVLVGPSGCGKTTILRMVAGLETPTRGQIYLGDQEVTFESPQARDLAMVFQSHALYPHKTVRVNLGFGLKLRRARAAVIADRVANAAKILHLEALLDRKPAELSGGERQRVALGRAIVREPRAFLLDEPLSSLDAQLRVQARAELAQLHRRLRATMLYVTHDQEEAMTLGQRIAVLREGQLQQLGPPMEIYDRPANVFVAGFIGSPPMNLFRCTAANVDGTLRLESAFFRLALSDQPEAIDGDITLGVRPQDCRLVAPAEADWVGQVDEVRSLGSIAIVGVRPANVGKELVVRVVIAESTVELGSQVGVAFRKDRLHLFDGNGKRIAVGSPE